MSTFSIRTTWRVVALLLVLGAPACSDDGSDKGDPDAGGTVTIPKAPSDVTVVPMAGGAHITWKDNSDNEDTFEIMRNGEIIKSLPFDSTQYHDPVVTGGETYKYMIHAGNAKGQSVSPEVVFVAPTTRSGAGR